MSSLLEKPESIPFEAQHTILPVDEESAKRELLDLLKERSERIKKRQVDQFFTDDGITGRDEYRKHIQFFNAGRDYRERVVFGGNRSSAPDMLIDTVAGPVTFREAADGSSVDVHSWDGEKQCTAPMSGWFLKGFEPMYRVLLGNGEDFCCTARHRILGADGQFHALHELLGRLNGLHYLGKAADFLASCAPDGYQYGEEFLSGRGTAPVLSPLPDGAQRPYPHVEKADVTGRILPHSQSCQTCGPQSTHGDLRPLAGLFDLFSSLVLPRASQALREKRRELQPHLFATCAQLLLNASALRRQSFLPACTVGQQSHVAAGSCTRLSLAGLGSERFVFGCNLDELTQQFARDTGHIPIFLTSCNHVLFGGLDIVAVIPVGYQPVLDGTVEGTHCYKAGGAYHKNTGKSVMGAFESALHLTGDYPHWWAGKRFNRPIQALAAGKEAKITRDTVQQQLLGKQGEFGTGMIPGSSLDQARCSASRAASGLYDGVPVRHKSGGWSMLRFRSYDQGRTAFEGVERDLVWSDEECPLDIHGENVMRTMTTGGILINTFTPLKGETPLVQDLLKRAKEGTVFSTNIWWDDVGHITQEMIDDMKVRYPNHELRARRFGEPQLGTGAVFTTDQDSYTIRATEIPKYWPRIYGLDFGWVHPTAALWGAHDRETDTLYIYSEHRQAKAAPAIHVGAIKARGAWMTGVSETVGTNQADGSKMLQLYKGHGLKLKRAIKGPGSIESGIMLIQERMTEGRLKILQTCPMLLEELRRYHRDKTGKVVPLFDDLIDSLRYLLTGLKYARTEVEAKGNILASSVKEVNFYGARRVI